MKLSILLILGLLSSPLFAKLHLTVDNTVSIIGPIDFQTAVGVAQKLSNLNDKKENKDKIIYLYIDSEGGSVAAADSIVKLVGVSIRPVVTVSVMSISAAFNIVQLVPGKRYMIPTAIFLTHDAFITGKFPFNDKTLRNVQESMQDLEPIYASVAKRLGMTLDEYYKLMSFEHYIRGENVLKINAADEIVEIECSKELILQGDCGR